MSARDPIEAIEAVAEAWASIDGRLEDFRAGKRKPDLQQPRGRYGGYMAEAEDLLRRIRARGYVLVPRGDSGVG